MQEFNFNAAALVDPFAEASIEDLEAHHDAPGIADFAAKTRRLAFWLMDEIIKKGFNADRPHIAEGGWTIDISPDDHGYVLCSLTGAENNIFSFSLLVTNIGDANSAIVINAIEKILGDAQEITNLVVVDD